MVSRPLKRIQEGHYKYTVEETVYEFIRMHKRDTGERTHWNIRIEGGQFFDAGNTLADCVKLAKNTSLGMRILEGKET